MRARIGQEGAKRADFCEVEGIEQRRGGHTGPSTGAPAWRGFSRTSRAAQARQARHRGRGADVTTLPLPERPGMPSSDAGQNADSEASRGRAAVLEQAAEL